MHFSISLVEALWSRRRGPDALALGEARAMLTRRKFLARTAMAAGVAALQPWELLRAGASEGGHARMVTPEDAPFDTVVVLMMENRSFDHLLGWLPSADGRQEGLRYPD